MEFPQFGSTRIRTSTNIEDRDHSSWQGIHLPMKSKPLDQKIKCQRLVNLLRCWLGLKSAFSHFTKVAIGHLTQQMQIKCKIRMVALGADSSQLRLRLLFDTATISIWIIQLSIGRQVKPVFERGNKTNGS
ncbi:MAG: hypothetical protein AB2704_03040 [Candidatus Thiodiazotropha taylori]